MTWQRWEEEDDGGRRGRGGEKKKWSIWGEEDLKAAKSVFSLSLTPLSKNGRCAKESEYNCLLNCEPYIAWSHFLREVQRSPDAWAATYSVVRITCLEKKLDEIKAKHKAPPSPKRTGSDLIGHWLKNWCTWDNCLRASRLLPCFRACG